MALASCSCRFISAWWAVGDHTSHAGMHHSMQSHMGMAIIVAVAHSLAMVAGGGAIAWLVHRYLGPAVSQEKLVQPASPVGCQPHGRRHGRYLVGDFKSLRPAGLRCSGHDKSLPMLGSQALRGKVCGTSTSIAGRSRPCAEPGDIEGLKRLQSGLDLGAATFQERRQ
jgi:hypothetical protein